jgi:hypothetical protein
VENISFTECIAIMDDNTVQLKYSLQGGAAVQTGPEGTD